MGKALLITEAARPGELGVLSVCSVCVRGGGSGCGGRDARDRLEGLPSWEDRYGCEVQLCVCICRVRSFRETSNSPSQGSE